MIIHHLVYVDTGRYELSANILVEHDDSGVTIQGPVNPAHAAVLDRANVSSGSYVLELVDADDVTVSHLTITGGEIGVFAGDASDSDRLPGAAVGMDRGQAGFPLVGLEGDPVSLRRP